MGAYFQEATFAVSFRECNRSHPGKKEKDLHKCRLGKEDLRQFENLRVAKACSWWNSCLLLVFFVEKKRVSGIPKFTKPHKNPFGLDLILNLILVSKRYPPQN